MAPFGKTNGKAIASFVIGLALPLLCVSGIPALILGFIAFREINRSDGAQKGRWLAIAGMGLGGFATALLVFGLIAQSFLKVREVANEVACQNNLRQIGFALQFYNDRNGAFPAGTVENASLPPEKRLSWYVALLPFLGQDPSRSKLDPNRPWYHLSQEVDLHQGWQAEANRHVVDTPIRSFVCPWWTGTPPASPPVTTYVGIAGLGEDSPVLPVEDPRAGVFGYDRRVGLAQITRGVSDTAMVIETAREVGPWAAGGPATVRPVVPGEKSYLGVDRPFGGLHPPLANVLFVDGSVRSLDDTVEPRVFEALATIHAQHK